MSIVKFIAIFSTLGALGVEGVAIRRYKTDETLILPPDINNEVLNDESLKSIVNHLQPRQIKCLEGKYRFCSKSMAAIKQTLKKAMIDDCASCDEEEKRSAGFVLASLLFYHPDTWNSMLAKYYTKEKHQRISPEMQRASRQRRYFSEGPPRAVVPESIVLRTKPLFSANYELRTAS